MKIFITGGAGYVGAVLTPYLLGRGYKVTVLDLMIYGENVLKNNPSLGRSINLEAFKPLVEIAKKNLVERFIYASTSSVYGIKKEKNVDETMSLEPLTDYSKYKVDCEIILKKYITENFTPVIIRPATVCGYSPRQRLDVVVNILTNLAYHKKEISVFGGDQLRPNIHIFDMARVYEFLINASKDKVSGQIFNAGYENQTVNHLAQLVKRVIGDDVKIKKITSDDNRSYHISSDKIKNVLKFSTEKTIEDAVRDLKDAFDKKILNETLTNEKYFNIKRMNNLKLK